MKSYYYVNVLHVDNVRAEGNDIIVSLQGRSFKSVSLHSAMFVSNNEYDGLALRLNTYSGNGFSTNRTGVTMCIFDNVVPTTNQYRYSITTSPSPTYFINETLNELNFSIIDDEDVLHPLADFQSVILILELEECE